MLKYLPRRALSEARRNVGLPLVAGELELLEGRVLLSTYYVATNGSDSSSGTEEAPFASLKPFFARAEPGDTAYIRGGTYYGPAGSAWSRQYTTVAGTAEAPITIAGYPGEQVLIDRGLAGSDFTFLYLTRSNAYLRFDNLHFTNFAVALNMYAESGYQPAHHIEVSNCEFSYSGDMISIHQDGKPIRMTGGAHDITIRNSEFHHVAGPGVYGLGDVYNVLIEDCVAHDMDDHRGTDGDADGFNFNHNPNTGEYPRNITIRRVTVWNTTEDGVDVKGDNVLIEDAVVWNVGANAFKAWSPIVAGVQGRFTFNRCVGFDAGETVFEAFYHPDVTLTENVFVGSDGSTTRQSVAAETTVLYKAYTDADPAGPWAGRLFSRDNVFMHLGQGTSAMALYFNRTNVVADMSGDTIYSEHLPNRAAWIIFNGTAHGYSNAQISAGALLTGEGIEAGALSRRVPVAPAVAPLPAIDPVPVGQTLALTAIARDADADALSYAWDFGDGNTADTLQASHAYATAGIYTITLTVRDATGQSVTRTRQVQVGDGVSPVNHAPVAEDMTCSTRPGSALRAAIIATDVDGDALTFGLASGAAHGTVSMGYTGVFTYTPASGYVGADSFTFIVRDGHDGADTGTVSIQVVNSAPVADDQSRQVNEDVAVLGAVTAGDADGDALTFSLDTAAAHGSVVLNANGSFTYTPWADWHGTDSFTFVARDAASVSAPATVTIIVWPVNDPPVAQSGSVSTVMNRPVDGAVEASDADGDPLSFVVVTAPAHGALSLSGDGAFTYTPAPGWAGPDMFTFVAGDGRSSSQGTVWITVDAGTAPVAQDMAIATVEDQPRGGQLLAGDAQDDPLVYALAVGPAHGTVSIGADGAFVYTPAANWFGSDSFTFTACDGRFTSATATVSVSVAPVNDAPTAQPLSAVTLEDQSVIRLLVGQDIDGDSLAFVLLAGPANGTLSLASNGWFTYTPRADWHGLETFTFAVSDGTAQSEPRTVSIVVNAVNDAPVPAGLTVSTDEDGVVAAVTAEDVDGDELTFARVAGPAHGTLSFNPDGSFFYLPAVGYAGDDGFTFTVTDGVATSGVATVAISVMRSNTPPVAHDLAVVADGQTVMASVTGGDADGDALTFRLLAGPSHGSVALAPDGAFTYTANAGWAGTDSFTFLASDGQADSAPAGVSVIVGSANQAPLALAQTVYTDEDQPLAFTLTGQDADGDGLTFQLVSGPAHGSVSLTADGSALYTPRPDWHGADSFSFRVFDGTAHSEPAEVAVRVASVNDRPIKEDRVVRGSASEPTIKGRVSASDPDGDTLTYRAASEPSYGVVVVAEDGAFTYTPTVAGVMTDTFAFVASDGQLDSDAGLITLEIGNRAGVEGRTRASYRDADGQTVTVILTGPGTGQILFDQAGDCDATTIVLNDTTTASQLIITVAGRGAGTTVAQIIVNGSLGGLTARAVDLLGDLTVTGTLARLTLRDVRGGYIAIGPGQGPLSGVAVTFGEVVDSSLDSATPLRSLIAGAWLDVDEAVETIVAPSLGSLMIRGAPGRAGDFQADLNLTGGSGARVLNVARIAGDLTGSAWTLEGSVGTVLVGGVVDGWSADVAGALAALMTGAATRVELEADSAGLLRLASWTSGSLSAGAVRLLLVGGDMGADVTLTAQPARGSTLGVARLGSVAGAWSLAGPASSVMVSGQSAQWELDLGDSALRVLRLGQATDVQVRAGAVGSVIASQWAGGSLRADTLNLLNVAGDLVADLTVTNGAAVPVAVGTISVRGSISGGDWVFGGAVRSIVAGAIDGLDAVAGSIASLMSRGDVRNARLSLSDGPGATAALGRLSVAGTLGGSTVRSAGNVGHAILGAMHDSVLLVGLRASYAADSDGDGVADLPTVADDFADGADPARLAALIIRGGRALQGDLFANANVAADRIGRVFLREVQSANAGRPFGVAAADAIDLVFWQQDRGRYVWQTASWPGETGDFVVRVV